MALSLLQYPASMDALIDVATEVIGDREAALRWMGTPVQALDFATPVSLLNSEHGFERVAAVLEQLQHGVL
jgi:putative toxin-antitoxin system antitoxin component (TIGR02293 family)